MAKELWEEAYLKDPTSINVLWALTIFWQYEQDYSQMLKYASELKQLFPGFDLAVDYLAWANYLSGNLEKAEYHWENIRKTGSMHSRHRLAFVMMQNGETEAAEKVLLERMHSDSTHVRNNPDKVIVGTYYDLAICNAFLENKEEAYYWMVGIIVPIS